MERDRDTDLVLQSLGEDLARADPRLAALLGDLPVRRHRVRTSVVLLLVLTLFAVGLLLAPTIALGATALLLASAAPLAVCWLCAEDPPAAGAP